MGEVPPTFLLHKHRKIDRFGFVGKKRYQNNTDSKYGTKQLQRIQI